MFSRKFHEQFKRVSRRFQGEFKRVARKLQGHFCEVFRGFQVNFKEISCYKEVLKQAETEAVPSSSSVKVKVKFLKLR